MYKYIIKMKSCSLVTVSTKNGRTDFYHSNILNEGFTERKIEKVALKILKFWKIEKFFQWDFSINCFLFINKYIIINVFLIDYNSK